VTDEELAAVIAALQAMQTQATEPPQNSSKWKRAARLESIDV